MQRQGMDDTRQLVGQHRVDGPMAGQRALADKLLTDQYHLEMALGTGSDTMHMALVADGQMRGGKSLLEFLLDLLLHRHDGGSDRDSR